MPQEHNDARYEPFVLKRYNLWTLLLNEKQRYLGRAVVWLHRPGIMQRFSELSIYEVLELHEITWNYELALKAMGWDPDHMNYLMLGNFFHEHGGHGHMHLVPRYKPEHQVTFMGVTFTDDRWGKNYTPETPMHVPHHILMEMVSMLRERLP
jgi:diadenosine tetraphosphate (Ap4A) HIT family hydrolase